MTIAPTVVLELGPRLPRSALVLTFCLATQHTAPKSSEIRANEPSLANSHLDNCGSPKFHTMQLNNRPQGKISKKQKVNDRACTLLSVKGFFSAHSPYLHPRYC